jgi:hypothetical protein
MRDGFRNEDAIGGDPIGSQHRPTKFEEGRTCAEPRCATRLSIYNGDDFCAIHLPLHAASLHAAEPRRRHRAPHELAPARLAS